ncbi:hypothetical protein [Alsobacter sp. R-9]
MAERAGSGFGPATFLTFFVLFATGAIIILGMSAFVWPFSTLESNWRSIAIVVAVIGFAGLAGLLMHWAAERTNAIRRKRRRKAAARAESEREAALRDAEALANLPALSHEESYALAWLLCRTAPRFEADIDEPVVTDLVRLHVVRATASEGVLAVAASVWDRREDILRALKPQEREAMAGSEPPWR